MKKRNEIDAKYKWDLSCYVKDEQELESNLKYLKKQILLKQTKLNKLIIMETICLRVVLLLKMNIISSKNLLKI